MQLSGKSKDWLWEHTGSASQFRGQQVVSAESVKKKIFELESALEQIQAKCFVEVEEDPNVSIKEIFKITKDATQK